MKRITITLEDEDLRSAIESEAEIIGATEQEVILQSLRFWLAESELGREEQREPDAARREYEEVGGVEARGFFEMLRAKASAMLFATWIVASVISFPLGILGIAVPVVTGLQLPSLLLNLSALMLVGSVPGVTYMFATRD